MAPAQRCGLPAYAKDGIDGKKYNQDEKHKGEDAQKNNRHPDLHGRLMV